MIVKNGFYSNFPTYMEFYFSHLICQRGSFPCQKDACKDIIFNKNVYLCL